MLEFPLDTLPDEVKRLLTGLPKVVGSKPEYGALGVLWATALCAPRTKVEIKDNYRIGLNLYGAIVAPKGDAKSPALGFTVGPLIKRIESGISEHSKEFKRWKDRLDVLKRGRNKSDLNAYEECLDQEPKPPWWGVITMGTSEGIRDTAKMNHRWGHPGYIGQFCEELDGWVKSMGKYAKNGGDGGEMGFYLQAYDGDVTIKANKGEKDSTPKFRLGLLGTIQPKVFRSAFDGKIENGLLDRFLIVTGDGKSLPKVNPYEVFDDDVVEDYDLFIGSLFYSDHPEVLRVEDDCRDLGREMFDWINDTDASFKAEAGSKWWVHFHKICGILAILWKKTTIDREIMLKATEMTKFLVTSWCYSFRRMTLNDVDEVETKITEILRTGPCSFAGIKRQITASIRGSVSIALEDMENEDIVGIRVDKARNGREVNLYYLIGAEK